MRSSAPLTSRTLPSRSAMPMPMAAPSKTARKRASLRVQRPRRRRPGPAARRARWPPARRASRSRSAWAKPAASACWSRGRGPAGRRGRRPRRSRAPDRRRRSRGCARAPRGRCSARRRGRRRPRWRRSRVEGPGRQRRRSAGGPAAAGVPRTRAGSATSQVTGIARPGSRSSRTGAVCPPARPAPRSRRAPHAGEAAKPTAPRVVVLGAVSGRQRGIGTSPGSTMSVPLEEPRDLVARAHDQRVADVLVHVDRASARSAAAACRRTRRG